MSKANTRVSRCDKTNRVPPTSPSALKMGHSHFHWSLYSLDSCHCQFSCANAFPHPVGRNSQQKDYENDERRSRDQRISEEKQRGDEEDCRCERITPNAVGTHKVRTFFTRHVHRSCTAVIERPDT